MEARNLNSKSWYRALKVFFAILFLIAQGIGFVIASDTANETKSVVVCDNGKRFEGSYFYLTDTDKLNIFKKCDITSFLLLKTEVNGVLTDAQMTDLGKQIEQMQKKGVFESDLQVAVDNYKEANADKTPVTPMHYTSVEELSRLYNHDFNDQFTVYGSGNKWVANFTVSDEPKHTVAEKLLYYALSFVIVSVFFWIISRIFFYVFAKEPFIKIPRQ